MPIPETQLVTWSHQGSITQSSETYNSIKNVLEANTTPYADKNFKVFLQGSYGNDTNIYAESDVDIIIRLDDCFQSGLSDLTDEERIAYKATFKDATYTHIEFKRDVLAVLRAQYGDAVTDGHKAITIDANGARRKADVIVTIQYRRYSRFNPVTGSAYMEGICFWDSNGAMIANYPKQHSTNLALKHQNTANWFKPMARVLKNIRSRLVSDGLIKAGTAPSYYIEGLLYNVPNVKFSSSYQECLLNVLNWYQRDASKGNLVCANEQYYLLRDGYATCWNQADCDAFIEATIKLWNKW
ncbi:nucleotidyltransferase domain-containing protein [Undibacterium luofuense]|uniref:Nucleotidyltransferase n=1 Tax=Undibacterium luofuense TaxID=2828733 RepID=A0A941DM88_9BURK|nr:nucleotidyltransferase [Undibacterium luofuense]MBR7780631.1 nucleotidyltransferase [Undibacterium luofuense]